MWAPPLHRFVITPKVTPLCDAKTQTAFLWRLKRSSFCRDKHIFVTTKSMFVATNFIVVAATANDTQQDFSEMSIVKNRLTSNWTRPKVDGKCLTKRLFSENAYWLQTEQDQKSTASVLRSILIAYWLHTEQDHKSTSSVLRSAFIVKTADFVCVCVCVCVYVISKTQTYKRLRQTVFIMTKHNMRIFGVSPFFKLQKTLQQQLSAENEM